MISFDLIIFCHCLDRVHCDLKQQLLFLFKPTIFLTYQLNTVLFYKIVLRLIGLTEIDKFCNTFWPFLAVFNFLPN